METVVQTYKFYDEKGRRLAIFAETVEGKTALYVFPCSKKDAFCKATARDLFYNYKSCIDSATPSLGKPLIIPFDRALTHKEFIRACNMRWYRKFTITDLIKFEALLKPIQ